MASKLKSKIKLLIDTEPLVLLIVGSSVRGELRNHGAIKDKYDNKDYDILISFVKKYKQIIVTPNILTEVSHHISCTSGDDKFRVNAFFKDFIKTHLEIYISSKTILKSPFWELEIADNASLEAIDSETDFLTSDSELFKACLSLEKSVINFNRIRDKNRADFKN